MKNAENKAKMPLDGELADAYARAVDLDYIQDCPQEQPADELESYNWLINAVLSEELED
jgi:hypothetical protein